MRTLRTATPIPLPSHCDEAVCPDILPSRRLSLASTTTHLPTLCEGSLDCNMLSKIVPPAFSPSELGKTEVIALVGSPYHPRRGQLFKSASERRRMSEENNLLPDLSRKEAKENVDPDKLPAPSEWVKRLQRPQQYELTRTVSHPVISKTRNSMVGAKTSSPSNSKSLPRINSTGSSRTITGNEHSAELRRHIQQENMDYDIFSTKAVILERFLNSQK